MQIENGPLLYCLREDGDAITRAADETAVPTVPADARLLAPLDTLIYDRAVTTALWKFEYTWEAYTPPARRVRGYHALPLLAGTELVGHVDVKADRAAGRLVVVARSVRRGHRCVAAVQELANWLGLKA